MQIFTTASLKKDLLRNSVPEPEQRNRYEIKNRFKNASAFLLRDARHAMHDILLLRISAILPEAISDGGLTPTTDTDLLLATYRGGSHLTSDISQRKDSLMTGERLLSETVFLGIIRKLRDCRER